MDSDEDGQESHATEISNLEQYWYEILEEMEESRAELYVEYYVHNAWTEYVIDHESEVSAGGEVPIGDILKKRAENFGCIAYWCDEDYCCSKDGDSAHLCIEFGGDLNL